MNRTIHQEFIPSTDPRLKRYVNHDSLSRKFAFDTAGIEIRDVEHECLIPVMDQGSVGSCTGNAGIACINTRPHVQAPYPIFHPVEYGAQALYSAAECVDGRGPFPPHDFGSSGLSVAKVLADRNINMIDSYQHTFNLNDALKALTVYPVIAGIPWYEKMYNPDPDGRCRIGGNVVGGHEIMAYRIDAANGRIWFRNSWGKHWGVDGCFYLTWADFATLLSRGGDVTVFIPLGQKRVPTIG